MSCRKVALGVAVFGLVIAFASGTAFAQNGGFSAAPGTAGQTGGGPVVGGTTGGNTTGGTWTAADMATYYKQASERNRVSLGFSEEEWKAIEPRMTSIQTTTGQIRNAAWGYALMARPATTTGTGTAAPAPEMNPAVAAFAQAAKDLKAALDNKDSDPKDIAAKLTVYRAARDKAKADVAKSQAELRALLTPRQEAQMVMWGTLE